MARWYSLGKCTAASLINFRHSTRSYDTCWLCYSIFLTSACPFVLTVGTSLFAVSTGDPVETVSTGDPVETVPTGDPVETVSTCDHVATVSICDPVESLYRWSFRSSLYRWSCRDCKCNIIGDQFTNSIPNQFGLHTVLRNFLQA